MKPSTGSFLDLRYVEKALKYNHFLPKINFLQPITLAVLWLY